MIGKITIYSNNKKTEMKIESVCSTLLKHFSSNSKQILQSENNNSAKLFLRND